MGETGLWRYMGPTSPGAEDVFVQRWGATEVWRSPDGQERASSPNTDRVKYTIFRYNTAFRATLSAQRQATEQRLWEQLVVAMDVCTRSWPAEGDDLEPYRAASREYNRAWKRYQAVQYTQDARLRRGGNPTAATRRTVLGAWEASDRRCALCDEVVAPDERITIDHIRPVSRGGTHDPDNLRVVHASCNIHRGSSYWQPGTDLSRILVQQDNDRTLASPFGDTAPCRVCRTVDQTRGDGFTTYYIEVPGFGLDDKLWLCPEHQNWVSLRSYLIFKGVPLAELDRPGQGETWVLPATRRRTKPAG
jgi:5-methylcytosine-specific restriction endonuclease McrA